MELSQYISVFYELPSAVITVLFLAAALLLGLLGYVLRWKRTRTEFCQMVECCF